MPRPTIAVAWGLAAALLVGGCSSTVTELGPVTPPTDTTSVTPLPTSTTTPSGLTTPTATTTATGPAGKGGVLAGQVLVYASATPDDSGATPMDDGGLALEGTPWQGTVVVAANGSTVAMAQTASDGSFSIRVPSGRYEVLGDVDCAPVSVVVRAGVTVDPGLTCQAP